MSTRVLAVMGSPRRHGSTEGLFDKCVAGIESAGGEADLVYVADDPIKPCQGCNACSLTGECVLHDAMTDVYPRIDRADAFLIASPVYWATVPAVLKAFYDRCQPYWARRFVLNEPAPAQKRPGALLISGGGGDPFGSDCVVQTTKSLFGVLAVDLLATLDVTGLTSPSDIGRHPDALQRAGEIGTELVRQAQGA